MALFNVVRLDVEVVILVALLAGVLLVALFAQLEDVRDAVLLNVVPFDVVALVPLAVFSAVLLDAPLVSREAGPRRARRSGRRPRRCRCI